VGCDVIADRVGQQVMTGAEATKCSAGILADIRCADFDLESGQKIERGLGARRVGNCEHFQNSSPVFV